MIDDYIILVDILIEDFTYVCVCVCGKMSLLSASVLWRTEWTIFSTNGLSWVVKGYNWFPPVLRRRHFLCPFRSHFHMSWVFQPAEEYLYSIIFPNTIIVIAWCFQLFVCSSKQTTPSKNAESFILNQDHQRVWAVPANNASNNAETILIFSTSKQQRRQHHHQQQGQQQQQQQQQQQPKLPPTKQKTTKKHKIRESSWVVVHKKSCSRFLPSNWKLSSSWWTCRPPRYLGLWPKVLLGKPWSPDGSVMNATQTCHLC